MTKVISIDIDGVICTNEGLYELRQPLPGASDGLKKLREKYFVVLHTGRHLNWAQKTIKWLKDHDMQYDHIVFNKPFAVAYIDDKGVKFESWEKIGKEF